MTSAIPLIDFGPAFLGEPGGLDQVTARVRHACETVGFFYLAGHGVLNDSGKDRYSIAFFYSPNVDAVIECAPTCAGPDNPPRDERAVYRDLVLAFYNANYFHRRDFARHPAA